MTTTLQEAYKENPVKLQHILPIDFHSVQKVPDSHLWPKINNFPSNVDEKTPNVPIIDLLAPNVVELIGHACKTWGVFQVVNHGVSSKLLDEVESQARRLFALPAEHKVRVLRSAGGTTGYGAARITPFFSKFMWHEGFTIMGSPLDHARELWPHDYQYFCDMMENYQKEMKALAYQLWLLILKYLEASQEDLNSELIGALQLNSYPCCPNPNHAIGLAPHTDSLFLTILHQTSNTNGLQFLKQGHGWTSISPVSDNALIVNVGDLLHILSNGEFPTVYHRVLVNQTKHRVSLAYFYGPPADSLVVPLISSKDTIGGVIPRYRSLTVKEYISLKAKHLEKAFSLIRF